MYCSLFFCKRPFWDFNPKNYKILKLFINGITMSTPIRTCILLNDLAKTSNGQNSKGKKREIEKEYPKQKKINHRNYNYKILKLFICVFSVRKC